MSGADAITAADATAVSAAAASPSAGCFGLRGVSLVVDPAMSDVDRLFTALCLTKSACEAFENMDVEQEPGFWSALYTLRQAVIVLEGQR